LPASPYLKTLLRKRFWGRFPPTGRNKVRNQIFFVEKVEKPGQARNREKNGQTNAMIVYI